MSVKKRKIHFPAWLLVVCISFGIFGDSVTAIAETSPDTEAYTDIFTSEWYRNGYEQGLYRNRGLDHTVGYKFQNETIGNILMMAEDPILLANGWNLATFFDGTVFKEIDIETLKELQAEGINDLGYLLEMSSYALASSYTLGATASDEYKNFSMDLYDDEHGTLYLLTLGSHTVYCINYGKHSPKGTTYSKKTLDDYLTTSQQEVCGENILLSQDRIR